VRNSYNISDCNQTLVPPFSITKIHAFLVNLQLNHGADRASSAPVGSPMTCSGKAYIDAITLIAIIKQAAIASIIRQYLQLQYYYAMNNGCSCNIVEVHGARILALQGANEIGVEEEFQRGGAEQDPSLTHLGRAAPLDQGRAEGLKQRRLGGRRGTDRGGRRWHDREGGADRIAAHLPPRFA
jgi:hypothetical protein